MATPFLSYHFPPQADAERTYQVSFGMGRVLKAMQAMDKASETVDARMGPQQRPIRAKRQLFVDVARDPLNFESVERFRGSPANGAMDFRVRAQMSYLDPAYRRLPIHGDTFLVRTALQGSQLTLRIARQEGLGRTKPDDVARLIRDSLGKAR
jgi:hypothetical protein